MILTLILTLASLASATLLLRTIAISKKYRFSGVPVVGNDLPTVSVCIAARNETHALAQCLERVLKSDYVKLEILVLDDSSSDDTSLIIKSFATAGVRFIPGSELPDRWLGKNHAYQTLIDEASGDLVLFLDVDTTINISTISRLVDSMQAQNKSMISVLPLRTDLHHPSSFLNTMRYHWELLLGTKKSPPASSALWMVRKSALEAEGIGFKNYTMSIRPERHLARQLCRSDSYRYYVADKKMGVAFEKRMNSQWETAVRLYYPMTGRTFLSWLTGFICITLLIAPVVVLLSWTWDIVTINWALWLILLNLVSLAIVYRRLHGTYVWRIRAIMWPLLILQEIVLMSVSFAKYRTNSVTWKGRKVTAQPTLHDRLTIDE